MSFHIFMQVSLGGIDQRPIYFSHAKGKKKKTFIFCVFQICFIIACKFWSQTPNEWSKVTNLVENVLECTKIWFTRFSSGGFTISIGFIYILDTVFPHIVALATILFWKLECRFKGGNHSREETITKKSTQVVFWTLMIPKLSMNQI